MNVEPYEQKFAQFIAMCQNASKDKVDTVLVDHPAVLGDTYEELTESLSRLADAGLSLHIAHR